MLCLMRWLRFFLAVFRDILWFAVDNRCYLSKKYELIINLTFILNFFENYVKLYENDMEIIWKLCEMI